MVRRKMTEPEALQLIDRNYVRWRGRKLLYFSGCDYFRLASHPRALSAAREAIERFGLNVAASRMTTGNHKLYEELEKELVAFFDASDALLVGSGYITNLIVAQALSGSFSHVFIDERAHSSLQDAARLFDCPVVRFLHQDEKDLARGIRRCGPGARIILLTDGMFAYNGSAAPLHEYLRVLPRDAMILVDDAHGAGVLGKTGRGTLEHAGVDRRRIIQTITLSKAFGTYGGGILGTRTLRRQILERSAFFSGHTPLPLPLAAAGIEAVELLRKDKSLRERLFHNAELVKVALRDSAFSADGLSEPGPIVSFTPPSKKAAQALERRFLRAGIFPPLTRYPGLPAKGYFRVVISSEHTQPQLKRLVGMLLAEVVTQRRRHDGLGNSAMREANSCFTKS